ncbi:MAG: Rpp14/Pop5 family protein [Candidatus Thermoplasmatota archaeon]|nr:Rpp14/Pop5 family protein [Candidatus Thermoplasmatota archaeon]
MVVKDKVGRKRYVGFTLQGGKFRRGEVIHAINVSLPRNLPRSKIQLTAFNGKAGIVLCPHTSKEDMCRAINGIRSVGGRRVEAKTIVTSGTIKKAKAVLEDLVKEPL